MQGARINQLDRHRILDAYMYTAGRDYRPIELADTVNKLKDDLQNCPLIYAMGKTESFALWRYSSSKNNIRDGAWDSAIYWSKTDGNSRRNAFLFLLEKFNVTVSCNICRYVDM